MNIKGLALRVVPWISIVLAIPIGLVAFGSMVRLPRSSIGQDAIVSILPCIIYLLTVGLSVLVLLRRKIQSEFVRDGLTGAFIGALIFQLTQLVSVVPRSTLIAVDGTANCALLFIPSLFVGLPLIVMGLVFGVVSRLFFCTQRETSPGQD